MKNCKLKSTAAIAIVLVIALIAGIALSQSSPAVIQANALLLWKPLGTVWAMFIGAVLVFVIRLLAAHFKWSLPHGGGK